MPLSKDLQEFVGLLNSNGVDYLISDVSFDHAWDSRTQGMPLQIGGCGQDAISAPADN
jgi:hypothetical protein